MSTFRYLLRSTIEFTTPFLIGSGRSDDIADATFAADANGLPAIPGSSLAGMLRAAFLAAHGPEKTNGLFGYQDRKDGQGSRLSVSWAAIHDSQNQPVIGIADPKRMKDDVLANAMAPAIRDHVRISHKGASDAKSHGKFDEHAVCAGHRFTFELELTGDESDASLWNDLLGVLASPSLRLGGKTRRAFGSFKFVFLATRSFNLKTDFADYTRHPVALDTPSSVLVRQEPASPSASEATIIKMELTPSSYWMFGGGYDLPSAKGDADMAPVRDSRILWDNGNGTVKRDILVIPGTAIKGAISHRLAFHYNAMAGIFADKQDNLDSQVGENNPAVKALFGFCKSADKNNDGQKGRVILDDLFIEKDPRDQLVHHVGIDRFTGGARDSVLFCERPLWKGDPLRLDIHVEDIDKIKDPIIIKALHRTLDDLVSRRLQLGAGSGRGNGFFTGKLEWPAALLEKEN